MTDAVSLYVHIPFCEQRCPYCNFNTFAGLNHLMAPYVEALETELALWSEVLGKIEVVTLYFGGGTPSLLPIGLLAMVLEAVYRFFHVHGLEEISLEANPGTLDLHYLRGLRDLGINRLSLGIQSLDDGELKALGRLHSRREALEAYRWAREAGFDNVNLDFIYGLPGQELPAWQKTLQEAISLQPDHLSLYALTVEEGTKLARAIALGLLPAPDPDVQAEMFQWAEGALGEAGYQHYEISNWARPGHQCLHNLAYWRLRPYLGVGAGAHSCLWEGSRYYRFWNISSPRRYITRLKNGPTTLKAAASSLKDVLGQMPQLAGVEEGGPSEAVQEALMMGLRLLEGVDVKELEERFGESLLEWRLPQVEELSELGLLELRGRRLRLTASGLLLANEVLVRLL